MYYPKLLYFVLGIVCLGLIAEIVPVQAMNETHTLTYANSTYSYQEYFKKGMTISFDLSSDAPTSVKITDATHIGNSAFSYYSKTALKEHKYSFEAPADDTYHFTISGTIKKYETPTNDDPVKIHLIMKNQSQVVRPDLTFFLTVQNRTYSSPIYSLAKNELFYYSYSADKVQGIENFKIARGALGSSVYSVANVSIGEYTLTASQADFFYANIIGNVHSHILTTYDPDIPFRITVTGTNSFPWVTLILILASIAIGVMVYQKRGTIKIWIQNSVKQIPSAVELPENSLERYHHFFLLTSMSFSFLSLVCPVAVADVGLGTVQLWLIGSIQTKILGVEKMDYASQYLILWIIMLVVTLIQIYLLWHSIYHPQKIIHRRAVWEILTGSASLFVGINLFEWLDDNEAWGIFKFDFGMICLFVAGGFGIISAIFTIYIRNSGNEISPMTAANSIILPGNNENSILEEKNSQTEILIQTQKKSIIKDATQIEAASSQPIIMILCPTCKEPLISISDKIDQCPKCHRNYSL